MARNQFIALAVATSVLAGGTAHAAAILNGSFTINTSSSQIGTVADSPGFSNLTLPSGAPQSTDLFDIFSLSTVAAQPISVAFSFTQPGTGPISAVVNGSVSASSGLDNAASVAFMPTTVLVPLYGMLSISLSGAAFASDYNGTVIATLVETVPEPSSVALFAGGLTGLAWLRARRRAWRVR